jgi:hypothetical protein
MPLTKTHMMMFNGAASHRAVCVHSLGFGRPSSRPRREHRSGRFPASDHA